jgi:hypothetical protein
MSFDRRNLRSMLCMRKQAEETWISFRRRQNGLLRRVMGGLGMMELTARLAAKQHGWAGHVVRLLPQHIAAQWCRAGALEDWHLKQAVGSHFDPHNKTCWKHVDKGAKVHWETNLVRVFGDQWRTPAMDRTGWRTSRCYYVSQNLDALSGDNAKPIGVKQSPMPDGTRQQVEVQAPDLVLRELSQGLSGKLLMERGLAHLALKRISAGLCLQVVGDSRILIDGVLGRACVQDPVLQRSLQLAHTALQTLVERFGARARARW